MKGLHIAMIVLWGIIGLAIVAVIVAGVVFRNFSGFNINFGDDFSSDMTLVVDETVQAGSLDKINIDLSSDECVVYITGGDSVNVKHYVRNIPERDYARVTSSGSSLDISTKNSVRTNIMFFGFISNRSLVEVYIPESYKNRLGVDISSGTLRFDSGIELSDLNVKISSGTIRAEDLIKAGKAEFTVTSGTIRFTGGLEANNYSVKASSGTINIDEKLSGSGSVNVTSGTVRLFGVDIADSLEVKASSGTINIELAGNPALDFTGHKSSGTINTYFNALHDDHGNYSATVGDGPHKKLDVQVTSGTVRVTSDS